MGSWLWSAVINFAVGSIPIIVLVLVIPRARAGVGKVAAAVRGGTLAPWALVGGAAGALFVASQGLGVPLVGVAVFTVAVVAGLTGNSLVADRLGVGPGGPRPITPARVAAAVITVGAVALAVSGGISGAGPGTWIALLVALIAGAAVAFQQGLNARVAVAAGSPFTAALVNFTVGLLMLLVVAGSIELVDGAPFEAPPAPWDAPGLWLGGPLGAMFVVIAAFAVGGLGVLLFSLLTIVGQLLGSVVVDLVAPVSDSVAISATTVGAVLLAIAATAIGFAGSRRGAPAAAPPLAE